MNKPTSITVFGVLNLVFGVLGLCGPVYQAVVLTTTAPGANPVLDVMRASSVLVAWTYASGAIGLLFTLVLIGSGVGLLLDKGWGRVLALGYGGGIILFALLGLLMNALFLFPALMELANSSRPEIALPATVGMIAGTAGGCVGFVYPALVLFFMTRKPVVEYLAGPR